MATTSLVTQVTGQVWVRGADGALTAVQQGMRIPVDADIVTATGASVQLQPDGLPPLTIGENRSVQLGADTTQADLDPTAAAVAAPADPAVAQVLAALNDGADPFEELDPTAAVLQGGAGGDGGSSFTRLVGVVETTTPLGLEYPRPGRPEVEDVRLGGAGGGNTENEDVVQAPAEQVPPPALTIDDLNALEAGQLTVAENATGAAVGSFTVNAEAGLAFLTVGNTTLTAAQLINLAANPVAIQTANGQITLTGFDPATGKVSYEYRVDGAQDHSAGDDSVNDIVPITVTDSSGRQVTDELGVRITDTNPTAQDDTGGQLVEDADAAQISGNVTGNDSAFDGPGVVSWTGNENTDVLDLLAQYGDIVLGNDGSWSFTLDNTKPATQALAEGQVVDFNLNYVLTDADGDAVQATLSFSVKGTNDVPTLTADDSASFVETDGLQTLSATGALTFGDLDTNDTVTITSSYNNDATWSGGTLTAEQLNALTGGATNFGATGANGTGSWQYVAGGVDLNFLAADETITFSYTITATDSQNATATETVTITITGTNDAPTLTADDSASFVETDGLQTLNATGALTFGDLDTNDTVTITSSYNNDATWSGGTLTAEQLNALTGGATNFGVTGANGTGSWQYVAGGVDLNFLAADETITFSYTITATDSQNATATETVTITITGTNDAPTLTADDSASFVETDGLQTLSATGALTFGDLDTNDTVTITSSFNNDATWSGGTLTAEQLNALTGGATNFGVTGANGTGSWQYVAGGVDLNFLAADETITFSYTITATDSQNATATETVNITIRGTNDAPVISFVDGSTVAVSEEGLDRYWLRPDGVPDAGPDTDFDTTNSTKASGTFQVSDVDNGATLGVKLGIPADALTSDGRPVAWMLSTDGQTLIGRAGHDDIIKVTLHEQDNGVYRYDVKLLGAVDHTDPTFEDVLDLGVPVTVTDGATTTHGNITVRIEDDSPHASDDFGGKVHEDAKGLDAVLGGNVLFNDGGLIGNPGADNSGWLDGGKFAWDAVANADDFARLSQYGTLSLLPGGSWLFTLNNQSSHTQALAKGQLESFAFDYMVTDNDGDSARATLTIKIEGQNDRPTLSATNSAIEFLEADGPQNLKDSGTLTFSDVDAGDTVSISYEYDNNIKWNNGTSDSTLTEAQINALTQGTSFSAMATGAGTGSWQYDAHQVNLDFLAKDETVTFSYTITATDSHGATADQVVTITITGTNDDPMISGDVSGSVQEDGVQKVEGQLSVADVDFTDEHTWSIQGTDEGAYGSITVDATGKWEYTLDNAKAQALKSGDEVTETFTVLVDDGNGGTDEQIVTITITGQDDAAVITPNEPGDDTGAVKEDVTLTANGTLDVSDPDADQAVFIAQAGTTGAYGTFSLDAAGNWTYTLDNSNTDVQALGEGKTLPSETFTVMTADGTTSTVTVTITGTNDKPEISGPATGAVQEDGVQKANGQLSVADVDVTDEHTWSIHGSNEGTYGSISIEASGKWEYTLDNAKAQALKAGDEVTETFTVLVDDNNGGQDTHTVTITITGTNDAPEITIPTGTPATVTEEGFQAPGANNDTGIPNGIDDNNGGLDLTPGADHASNPRTATGAFSIGDVDGDALTVSLGEPATPVELAGTGVLASNGQPISAWTWDEATKTLTGSLENGDAIIQVKLTDNGAGDYSYDVALLGAVDHPRTEGALEDVLTLKIPLHVGDGQPGGNTTDYLEIRIEDDSPSIGEQAPSKPATAENLEVFSEKVDFSNQSGIRGDDGLSLSFNGGAILVTANGFTAKDSVELTGAKVGQGANGLGVESEAANQPYFPLAEEVDFRRIDDGGVSEELIVSLQGKVAYGASVTFAQMFGGEKEVGIVEFWLGDKLVTSKEFSSEQADQDDDGNFHMDFTVEEGRFDTIVFKATDNGVDGKNDNSDFTVAGIEFIGTTIPAIAIATGDLTFEYGADGAGGVLLTGVETGLQLGGQDINSVINEAGTKITGTTSGGELVYELYLTGEGHWELIQYQRFSAGDDGIEFKFTVTDADGDGKEGVFHVMPLAQLDSTLTLNDLTVDEGTGATSITATLSHPSDKAFTVTLSNGSTITFEAGQTSATSTPFNVQGDDVYQDGNTERVSVVNQGNHNFANLETISATVVIEDTIDTTTLTLNDVTVNEGVGTATITASLDHAPETTLVVKLSNGATITFEPDYVANTPVSSTPFTINNGEDVHNDASSFDISVEGATGGNFEALNTADTAKVTVQDTIDTTTLTLDDVTVDEGTGTATITASLDHAPETQLVVQLSNGATITFGPDYVAGTTVSSTAFDIKNGEDVYNDGTSVDITVTGTTGGNFEALNTKDAAKLTVNDTIDETTVAIKAFVIKTSEIDVHNVDNSNSFTVTAYRSDKQAGEISKVTGTDHDGFGVKGSSSGSADNDELGYRSGGGEKLVVEFNNEVKTFDVQFAWRANSERAKVEFFDDAGTSVGWAIVSGGGSSSEALVTYYDASGAFTKADKAPGGSDKVDLAYTFEPGSGLTFTKAEFTAVGHDDDYLVHSIKYREVLDEEATSIPGSATEVIFEIQTSNPPDPTKYDFITDFPTAVVEIGGATYVVKLDNTGRGTVSVPADGSQDLTAEIIAVHGNFEDVAVPVVLTLEKAALTIDAESVDVSEVSLAGVGSESVSGQLTIVDGDIPAQHLSISLVVTEEMQGMTSGGLDISWVPSNNGQTLQGFAGGQEVIKVTVDNTGRYDVTLSGPVDHSQAGQDTLALNVGVRATGGNTTVSSNLTINIQDDIPVAASYSDQTEIATIDTNVLLMIDVSGSMGGEKNWNGSLKYPSGVFDEHGNELTRLEVAKRSIAAMLDKYDDLGDVKVRVVTFNSSGAQKGGAWLSVEAAKEYIDDLSANGGTDYDAALNSATSAWNSQGKIAGANNVSYFFSDGDPSSTSDGIDGSEQADWETFLKDNDINSYAVGMGTNVKQDNLKPIAYDGVKELNSDTANLILVDDFNDLADRISDTVGSALVQGELFSGALSEGADVGADGGYLQSITVDGITYSYDQVANAVSVNGGTSAGVYNAAAHTLTITTELGAKFVINLDTGVFTHNGATQTGADLFNYTVMDGDGDSASSTLTVTVAGPIAPDAVNDHVITNILSSQITIDSAILLANDERGTGAQPLDDVTVDTGWLGADFTRSSVRTIDFDGKGNSNANNLTVARSDFSKSGQPTDHAQVKVDGYLDRSDKTNNIDTLTLALVAGEKLTLDHDLPNDWIKMEYKAPEGGWTAIDDNSSFVASETGDYQIRVTNIQDPGSYHWLWGWQPGSKAAEDYVLTMTVDYSDAQHVVNPPEANDSYTINGAAGSDSADITVSYQGGDTLQGTSGHETLLAGDGDDTLIAGAGDDVLVGGQGNDSLTGGSGNDTFLWLANDQGTTNRPAVDSITDFGIDGTDPAKGNDVLDLADLLVGEQSVGQDGQGNLDLDGYLNLKQEGADTVIQINTKGNLNSNGNNADQEIVLKDIQLEDLAGHGTQNEMIKHLIDAGKLNVDQ